MTSKQRIRRLADVFETIGWLIHEGVRGRQERGRLVATGRLRPGQWLGPWYNLPTLRMQENDS